MKNLINKNVNVVALLKQLKKSLQKKGFIL